MSVGSLAHANNAATSMAAIPTTRKKERFVGIGLPFQQYVTDKVSGLSIPG
jgi:hypothetical protein